jgi:putative endonuclease
MAYVYILRSLKNNKRYVGCTAKHPSQRVAEHNGGNTQWTRQNGPFMLLHVEEFPEPAAARKRERFLKSGKGRQWLDRILSTSSVGEAGCAADKSVLD